MKKVALTAALAAVAAVATPVQAANADGKWQVKLLATGVLPDGKITSVSTTGTVVAVGAGTQTKANDNVVPTVAIEYYFTKNISVETICCLTNHHVDGTAGSVASVNVTGVRLVDHALILPATVTVKYHLDAGPIKPYVGVGPTAFFFIDERPGAAAATALALTRAKLDNAVGVALQAGADIPIGNTGLGISLDAKKYFVKTTAHFYQAGGEVLRTNHKLDPWVVSGGIYARF